MTLARQTGDPRQAGGAITLSSHPDAAPPSIRPLGRWVPALLGIAGCAMLVAAIIVAAGLQ